MRIFGHPAHTMVIHFPVALWPAHAFLHLFEAWMPSGVAGVAGFWVLAAGTALGWVAALCGASDLLGLVREHDQDRLRTALVHASVNGAVLLVFTVFAAIEASSYPFIAHGGAVLACEFMVLAAMGVGNWFGGNLIWKQPGPGGRRP